jgi:hypothetical protein
MKKIALIQSIVSLSLALLPATIAVGQESKSARWFTLGNTNDGKALALNDNSIEITEVQLDDSINNEDGFHENLPMTKVVQFDYRVGRVKRNGYTKSCKNGAVVGNPNWKTYRDIIDYKPQYYLVEADSAASKKMIQRVCDLSTYKVK